MSKARTVRRQAHSPRHGKFNPRPTWRRPADYERRARRERDVTMFQVTEAREDGHLR